MTKTEADRVIENLGNGWWRAAVPPPGPLSDAAAVCVDRIVTWRTQRVECCGQALNVADGERIPVWISDPHGLTGRVTQCRSCGALYSAAFG